MDNFHSSRKASRKYSENGRKTNQIRCKTKEQYIAILKINFKNESCKLSYRTIKLVPSSTSYMLQIKTVIKG
jgi:hypothetical protein